jgi:PAS domain S-box-containing protein/putative nucleotidyltransferase with HDIG domain
MQAENEQDLRTQKALRAEQRRMEQLFASSLEGVVLLDAKGRILRANRSFCDLFGFASLEEVVGKELDLLVSTGDKYAEASEITARILRGENVAVEVLRYRTDGRPLYVDLLGTLIPPEDHEGDLEYYVIYRDISERKRAEATLRESLARLERAWEQTIQILASVVELRDPYTAGHQRRVAVLAQAVARDLGLPEEEVRGIYLASLVHDVGKITVPAEVLSKPGVLSSVEFALIRTHAEAGYNILRNIDFPWPVAEIVLQHHERLDGSGYPNRLSADALRTEARILAVADVVEAMASNRPYRPSRGLDKALEEIDDGAGKRYDARVVASCRHLFQEGFAFPSLFF